MTYSLVGSSQLLESIFDEIFKDFPVSQVRSQFDGFPVANLLCNKDGDFKIELALTGYEPDDIEVALDDRILVVRGGIKSEDTKDDHEGFKFIHHRIKGRQKFERRFSLPRVLDLKRIKIKHKNGLLTIDIKYDHEKTYEQKLIIE